MPRTTAVHCNCEDVGPGVVESVDNHLDTKETTDQHPYEQGLRIFNKILVNRIQFIPELLGWSTEF